MKRYWVPNSQLGTVEHGGNPKEVILASEVEAELAQRDMNNAQKDSLIRTLESTCQEYASEVARLRKALEFYANKKNWEDHCQIFGMNNFVKDKGKIAREALERKE